MREPVGQQGQTSEPTLDRLRPVSRARRILRIAVAFAAAVLICSFLDQRAFRYLEQYSYNMRVAVYAARDRPAVQKARQQVVLVSLSDDAFAKGLLPGTPPLPRNCHAKLIRDLTRAGAKVIVFDLLFDSDKPQDAELAAAAKSSGRVLWASSFEDEDDGLQRAVLPNARLRQASPHFGHMLLAQDRDLPAADRIEAVVVRNGMPVPALSLKAVMMAGGLADEPIRRSREGWRIGRLVIPVDEQGCFRIAYLGRPDETFASVPYEQVYAGAVDDEFYRKNRFFKGKIVLIGDATTGTGDCHYTSVGDMYGVEIHAHAITTLLQGRFVREAPAWMNLVVICLLAGLICPLAAAWHLLRASLASGALLVGYFLVNTWLFTDHGIWLHLVAPLSSMFVVTLGLLTERAFTEEREKRRMRWLLHRYVSPEIAEYILANKEAWAPGGKRVTATVLFADIRGFTALSEKLPPEAVVERLNEYLKAMTAIAFQHNGTVDKYVGDAIMVLFGIPVEYPDHAYRAVESAIDMQSALMSLQERWAAEGLPDMNIGIGINTGEMVAGNIGSADRLEYTVVGDAVNIAAHTEGLNKELGTRILITQATYELVKDHVLTRGPLVGKAKGKSITVYDVVGRIEHLGGESPPAHQT